MRKFTPILSVLLFFCLKANSQLSGTKTIPGDYATLSAAVTALNAQGVGAGGVTFNIAAGYTESISATISLTATGTSANPIVFQKSGSGANPLITSYTTGTATPTSAIPDGIIALNGSDYVTFDGIDLLDNAANTTTATTMEYGFGLFKASATDGCQYNTIKNCTITLNRVNNTAWTYGHNGSLGIAVHNTTSTAATTGLTPTAASGSNSYNKFYSNTIQNCNAGISFNGYAAPSPFTLGDTGNDVGGTSASTGNIVKNFGGGASATNPANGVFAKDQWSLNCSYNTINSNDGAGVNHPNVLRGIYFNPSSTSASVTISNNTITLKGGGTTHNMSAIENSFGSTAASNTVSITNNTVTNCTYTTATTGVFYGIYSTSSPSNLVITGNTISNCSTNATTAATYLVYNSGAVASSINISNNTAGINFPGATAYSGTLYAFYNSSGTTATNVVMSNNTYSGTTFTTTGTGAIYFHYNTNSSANLTINGNTANGLTLNHSGSQYYIYNSSSTQVALNVNNNSFTNITRTAGAGTFYFYYAGSSSLGTSTQTFSGNTINGLTATTAGTGTVYLFYTADGATSPYPKKTFYGNTFKNINYNTTGSFYITYISYLGDGSTTSGSTVYNNVYDSITCASSTLYGLYSGSTVSPTYAPSVYNNRVSNITATGTASIIYSCYLGASTIGLNFYNNKVYNITATGATATVYGVYTLSSAPYNIYNNIIGDLYATTSSKTAPAPSVAGIYVSTGSATYPINIHYNTVSINATGTGTNFGTAALYANTTPTLNLRNNILVNNSTANGTGKTVVYQRSSTTLTTHGSVSNNNDFYVPSTGYVYIDGTNSDATLLDFKNRLSNREGGSFAENPTFVSTTGANATYLHISPTVATQIESNAIPIAGVTTDYDGDTRNSSIPDVGADEFTGVAIDLNPPAISYTALSKQTICTTSKTITAAIADASGVNTTAGTKPRLWYKKSTENDVLAATNTSASNGWKYVEASNSTSPFSFTFNFGLLTSPLNPGDSVSYFIVAQDNLSTPNVGASIVTFSSNPTSVALGSVFPTSGNINGFNVLNQPVPILIKTNKADACRKDKVTLDVDGVVVDGGEFQWQSSPSGANTWTNIVGATTVPYTTDSLTASTDFRLIVSCGGTPIASSPSTVATFIVNNPQVSSTTPATRCGTGTVNLSATAPGYDVKWYANANGGIPLTTGNTFTTPSISATTTYYVAAATTGSPEFVGRLTPVAGAGTALTTYGQDFTVTTNLMLNSVDVYSAGGTAITISLYNTGGVTQLQTTNSITVTAGTSTTPLVTTIPLGWTLAPGTYRLVANGMTGNFIRENSSVTYPIALSTYGQINGFVSAITGTVTTTASYYFMYNWNVTAACEGTRTAVAATVTAPPSISVSSPNSIVCNGSSATLNVSSSNSSYVYTWTPGNLSGASQTVTPTTTTKYYVAATDASGGTYNGCSNIDSVTVTVNPVPSSVSITASATTICNTTGSAAQLTVNGGTIPTTSYIGTQTTNQSGSISTTNMPPYGAYYTGNRHQMLITAAELTAAGLLPGSKISSLAFDVVSNASTVGYQNFVIKVGATTATALTTTFETSATTEVYNASSPLTPVAGWNEHTFSAPFTWDGTSNLLVETYFSNCGNTSASSCSGTTCTGYGSGVTYSQNAVINQSTTSFVSHSYYYNDATSCNIQTQATATTTVSVRPNMKLSASIPTTFAWTPLTGLFTDAAATIVYTGTNLTTVYAKPSVTTLYTATASTSVPCSASSTKNIVVDCSSVPVTLLNFNGERRTGFNILSWTTATEVNNAGFELERSNDGLSFSKIASIASKSVNGNSNQQLSYSFNDYNQLTVNAYYRLKQLDKNGKFYYSAVVLIKAGKATQIEIVSIYPNPVKNELNIKIASPVNDKVELQLTDVSGKVLVRREVSLMSGDNVFNIPVAQFAQGVYLIKTICANGCESAVKKFVKQ